MLPMTCAISWELKCLKYNENSVFRSILHYEFKSSAIISRISARRITHFRALSGQRSRIRGW